MGEHPRIERGPRFTQVLAFLEESGGVYQRPLKDFARDVGIPQRSLGRVLHRMKELHVIRVIATAGDFGEGRYPNKYEQLVSLDEWNEHGLASIDAEKRERRNAKRRGQRYEVRTAAELAAEAVAARHVEEARAAARADVGDDFDVDAWLV